MKIDRIYVDMDGVLADFIGGTLALYARPVDAYEYHLVTDEVGGRKRTPWPLGDYNGLYEFLGETEAECWAAINERGAAFWEHMSPYPWASMLWANCAVRAQNGVTVLSSPSRETSCLAGKLAWLHHFFEDESFRDYVFCPAQEKQQLSGPGRVLIDDRDDNCKRWIEAGGAAIVFPRYWNSMHARRDDPLAYTLDELNLIAADTPAPTTRTTGHKDAGLRYDLLPQYPMAEVALVYTLGAKKYADHNWRKGLPFSKCIAAAQRHLARFAAGEARDPDGQHHLASVVFMALALMEYEACERADLDDRFASPANAKVTDLIKAYVTKDRPEGK